MNQAWNDASVTLPGMHTEIFEDFDDEQAYEVSDPVIVFTEDRKIAVAKCCYDSYGNPWWFDDDGTDYRVTHWQELPKEPVVKTASICDYKEKENG